VLWDANWSLRVTWLRRVTLLFLCCSVIWCHLMELRAVWCVFYVVVSDCC